MQGWREESVHKEMQREFEWFHRHPELSFEEVETTKRIDAFLTRNDIEILELPLKTGLVACIRGGLPGAVTALRCDIDALPVDEQSGLSYASEVSGKMHACGHDFHTTAMLYAALFLHKRREQLRGTVKIIFQPAEESSVGAPEVIKTGGLDDVSVIFGLHVDSTLPVGAVGIAEGSVTAAVDRFVIRVQGMGTHAAHPQDGVDPIVAGAHLVTAAQSIVSRNIDPFSQGLLSITRFTAGNTWNVIAQEAELEGTVRTLQKKNRLKIRQRLESLSAYTAQAFGAQSVFEWFPGPPATENDSAWVALCRTCAQDSGLTVRGAAPSMGGEDFAFYQERIPGVFIRIGTGASLPNHHPGFKVDPAALPGAAAYMAYLAEEALAALAGGTAPSA